MSYNPYTLKVEKAEREIASLTSSVQDLESELSWFRDFDASAASEKLQSESSKLEASSSKVQKIRTEMESLRKKIEELERASKVGWVRSYWPLTAKQKKAKKSKLDKQGELVRYKHRLNTATDNEHDTRERIAVIRRRIDKFNAFEEDIVKAEISRLYHQIEVQKQELEGLKNKKIQIERLIGDLIKNIEEIDRTLSDLKYELSKAKDMEDALKRASNGYERKQIHDKCAKEFDNSSPSRVRNRIKREIERLDRNKSKIKNRISKDIQEREGQDIQSIVIDGSNLCYDGDKLIGLSALKRLCSEIPDDIHVEVVFDGTILKTLGLRDSEQLYTRMEGIKVHLDDNPSGADELILNAASKSTSYVISGDRFGDFADKPVVRENRVLRVRFINGTVQVRRMDISFEY